MPLLRAHRVLLRKTRDIVRVSLCSWSGICRWGNLREDLEAVKEWERPPTWKVAIVSFDFMLLLTDCLQNQGARCRTARGFEREH